MRIVYNKVIPFKGFRAINLFGILFVRLNNDGSRPTITERLINHESIHTAQMKELLYVPFYLLYFLEWIVRLFVNHASAYRSISFEREAYYNEYYYTYLSHRKPFAWLNYIKNPSK